MSVEDVSKLARVPANTVRYYARRGLLRPERNPENGYRVFSDADLTRLRFIRQAKEYGLTLGQIRSVFAYAERGTSPCELVRSMVRGRARETAARIAELAALHAKMERALERWEAMPDRMPDGSVICHLFESLDDAAGAGS